MKKYLVILFLLPNLSFGQNKIIVSIYNKTELGSIIFTEDSTINLKPKDSVQITINKNKYLHENRILYNKFVEGKESYEQYTLCIFDDKKVERKIIDSTNHVMIVSTENEEIYSRLFFKNNIRKGVYDIDSLVITNKNNLLGAEILYTQYCLRNEPLNKIDSLYSLLDSRMKKTYIGKSIESYLETKPEKIAEGNKIRNFSLSNTENKLIELNSIKSEYILLDFWFVGCGPCIKRFETLKGIYKKSNTDKFEIVAVTIDKIGMKTSWLELIDRMEFNWINLIDSDRKLSFNKYRINEFPTSILLDKKRRIIKVNPSDEEIKAYLN